MKTFLRFLFPALLLTSIASAQDFSQKVTYEAGGVSAKKVVDDLAKMTSIQMQAGPVMAGEVLVVRVKDVTLNDLMKKLAEVTSGEWKKEGEILYLSPSNGKRSLEAATEKQERVAAIQKALDQLLKPAEKPTNPGMPAAEAMFGMGGGGDPGSKAILTILTQGRITATTLANIEDGGRIVFSSQPTRMQIPLNFNSRQLVQSLVADHNKFVDKQRETEANRTKSKEEEEMEKFASMFGFGKKPQLIKSNFGKLLLVATRQNVMDGISLQLKLFDEQGQVVLTGMQMVMVDMGMWEGMEDMIPGQAPKPAKVDEKDKPIVFSARTKSLMDFFKTMSNPMMAPKKDALSKDLLDTLLHPETTDPLSFIQGEAVLAVAKEKNLNVVADLPDDLLSFFGMMFSNRQYMIDAYLRDLQSGKTTKAEVKDGWLTIWPAKPAESRRTRTDRVALSAFINLANLKGIPSLEDYAAYALKSEPPMESPGAALYLMFFAPNTMQQGMGGMTNWDMLRLYGTLSVGQKQGLAGGNQLRFGMLSPQQRGIVQKLVFGASAKLQSTQNKQSEPEHPFVEMARSWMPSEANDYRDEPTEIMPNGLPGDGYMTLALDRGHFTMVASEQSAAPSTMFGALGADELAMFRYFKEDPQFSAFANFIPAMDKFRLGQRETLTFRFWVAPDVMQTETLKNDRMDKDAQVVAYSNLPSEFRDRIEKRVEIFKKNPLPFGAMMGGQGGFRPPQP